MANTDPRYTDGGEKVVPTLRRRARPAVGTVCPVLAVPGPHG